VRDFVNAAFKEVGIAVRWEGSGVDEKGYDAGSGALLVEVDTRYFRPTEVETLLGDPAKAKEKLGWVAKTSLEDMVAEMVRDDLRIAERDEMCKREGFQVYNYNE
jgi:GDPmannose 4,6-dehydratase